jgi:RNA polymerase sigma-70 factor (ECF subfamily)
MLSRTVWRRRPSLWLPERRAEEISSERGAALRGNWAVLVRRGQPSGCGSVTKLVNDMGTDHRLIQRAIEGDERALRALWSQHAPHIDAVVRRLAGDPDLAEDIAQEVWIQIFRSLPGYRGDSQFSTWAHRIAVNRTLNALRRTRRLAKIETEIDDEAAAVDPDGERTLLMATIEEAAARLAPGARAVFYLHDVEGYTHEEIAVELGITAGGSKSQLFKARAKLRKLLAPMLDAPHRDGEREHAAPGC